MRDTIHAVANVPRLRLHANTFRIALLASIALTVCSVVLLRPASAKPSGSPVPSLRSHGLLQDNAPDKTAPADDGVPKGKPLSAEDEVAVKDLYRRGKEFRSQGQNDRAIEMFNEALKLDPQLAGARVYLGILQSNQGNHDQAILEYTKALELRPEYAVAFYNRAIEYRFKKDFLHSLHDDDDAIRLSPLDPDAFYGRGISYVGLKRYDLAISDFDRSLQLKPNNVDALVWRGVAYARSRNDDRAIEDYNEAIRLHPTSVAYKDRASANFRKGHLLSYASDKLSSLRPKYSGGNWKPLFVALLNLFVFSVVLLYLIFKLTSSFSGENKR